MSDQDAVAYDKQRQQGTAIYRLQGNQQEQENRQVYQELEIGACAYLILKSGGDAMDGTDDEHHQQIAEYCQFPRLEDLQVEEFPDSQQLIERAIEQLHLVVEEGVSEQHPVWQHPSEQRTAETTRSERLETVGFEQPKHREDGELWEQNTSRSDKEEGVE